MCLRVCRVSAVREAIRTSRFGSSASSFNTWRGTVGCLATAIRTYQCSSVARVANTSLGVFRFLATRTRTCQLLSPARVFSAATGTFRIPATRTRTAWSVSVDRFDNAAAGVFGFDAAALRTFRLSSLASAAKAAAGVFGLDATTFRTDGRLWAANCSSTSGEVSEFRASPISLIALPHPCFGVCDQESTHTHLGGVLNVMTFPGDCGHRRRVDTSDGGIGDPYRIITTVARTGWC